MIGITHKEQWQIANGIWILGNLGGLNGESRCVH